MESCFGTIKTELVHHACYPTREAARHDLFAYIEGYYNRQRLHSALGYITPEQAERRRLIRCPLNQGKVTDSLL
jgi:transposase InsO family protein